MNSFLAILLIIAMIATLGVLFVGMFAMARGGEFNKKYGNTLMRYRVLLQGLAIFIFILFVLFARH
jgi:hypothetical protein